MIFTIALIAGIICSFNVSIILATSVALIIVYLFTLIRFKRHIVCVLLIGFVFGYGISHIAHKAEDSNIYVHANKDVPCIVIVDSVPNVTEKYIKFEGTVCEVNGKATHDKVIFYVYDAKDISINQKITFSSVKFKLPSGRRNFGSFDYAKYLKGKGIFFTATASNKNIIKIENTKLTIIDFAKLQNAKLSEKIDKTFKPENAGLFKAILLGNKQDVDDEMLGAFRQSGLSHVMAVSGLHLAILVMLMNLLFKRLGKKTKFVLVTVVVVAFAFLVGMPVSVIRAAVMLVVLQFADAVYWEGDSLTNLSLAALIVLVPNPNAIYDIGFVMSFAATCGILCLGTKIKRFMPKSMPNSISECVSVTISAQIGTLPFSAMYFGQLSFLSVISNLLIVVLLPLIYLFGIPSLFINFTPLISFAEWVISLLSKWASFCACLPGQMQNIPINNIIITGMFVFSGVALVSGAFKNKKIAVWFMLLGIVVSVFGVLIQINPVDGTEITFLNVEQSDSALVRTEQTAILIDCGTEYMGDAEVVGYLLRNGVDEIDGMFISHFDSDHCGGAIKVMDNIKVNALYIPDTADVGLAQYRILQYASSNNIPVFTLSSGDKIKFVDITAEVLHPFTDAKLKDGDNNSSLVIRVDNEDTSVLFPGDLQQDNLLKNCDTDILKVSHHGSKNGSTEEFLKMCTPKISVISLAKNNSYGFPHPELMDRLSANTDKIYRTDINHTVIISCNDKKYVVKTMK